MWKLRITPVGTPMERVGFFHIKPCGKRIGCCKTMVEQGRHGMRDWKHPLLRSRMGRLRGCILLALGITCLWLLAGAKKKTKFNPLDR